MIGDLLMLIFAAGGLVAAGAGLLLLWQREQTAYDPVPERAELKAWEVQIPSEYGGTYGVNPPSDGRYNEVTQAEAVMGLDGGWEHGFLPKAGAVRWQCDKLPS